MDRTKLIAALMDQYRMSPDLAGRVADNLMRPGGAKRAYQAAITRATAPEHPMTDQLKSMANDAMTIAGSDRQYNPGANDRYLRRTGNAPLADIVAQGNAPAPQPRQSQGENYVGPVTLDKRSAQLKQQQAEAAHAALASRLTAQYGYDPAAATQISAALLSPTRAPSAQDAAMFRSTMGPRKRN